MRNLILIVLLLTCFYLAFSSQNSEIGQDSEKKDLILKEKTEQKESTQQDFTDIENLPNLFAILVGVNKYEDENINSLRYAVADVTGIHDILNNRKRVPYKKSYIHLLTDDSAKKPTRINIYASLGIVRKMAEPDDTILFYFSGHGIEEEGLSFLLPSDTTINALKYSTIRLRDVHSELSKSKAKRQVIILDACHSGGVRRDKGIGVASKEFTQSVKDIMASAEGRVVLSSSDVDGVSYEFADKGHGVYTYYLMGALAGKGDRDNNGFVTVQEAHQYVFENVRSWTFDRGLSQTPRIDLNMSGSIVLTVNPDVKRISPITQKYEPETIIADFDGAEMVRIPAGKFTMGSKLTRGNSDEHPRHEVYLDDFYIDLHEVTNVQYAIFLEATGYPKPEYWNDERFNSPEQPVVGVSWYDANEYAKWVGRRLPTEAEWEKAARGVDRHIYPWGNEWNEKSILQSNAPVSVENKNLDESPYKVRGMATNVAEWVADYYKEDYYLSNAGSSWINPLGPKLSGFIKIRVIRGASWKDISSETARCARRNRNMPNMKFDNVGFRLVKSVVNHFGLAIGD